MFCSSRRRTMAGRWVTVHLFPDPGGAGNNAVRGPNRDPTRTDPRAHGGTDDRGRHHDRRRDFRPARGRSCRRRAGHRPVVSVRWHHCLLYRTLGERARHRHADHGGSYHYINQGLGPFFGAIAGLGNWLGLAFATACYVIGFGSYLGLLLAAVVTTPTVVLGPVVLTDAQLGGIVAAISFVAVNYVSTKITGDLQNVIVIGLLGILAGFVIAGTYVADLATLRPVAPEGWDAVLPGTALIFVSYLGFVKITTVAGEIRDPSRNLPRALVGSVALVTVLYGIIMIVVLGIVDRGAIATSETAVVEVAGIVTGELVGIAGVGVGGLTLAGRLATASSRSTYPNRSRPIRTSWSCYIHSGSCYSGTTSSPIRPPRAAARRIRDRGHRDDRNHRRRVFRPRGRCRTDRHVHVRIDPRASTALRLNAPATRCSRLGTSARSTAFWPAARGRERRPDRARRRGTPRRK